MTPDFVPADFRNRTWYWASDGSQAFAFLVDAPITFGHLQLQVEVKKGQEEEHAFTTAADHIANCIRVFRTTFSDAAFIERWKPLAVYTNTMGGYEKTLVLKASASEDIAKVYKVHLVPYFLSHVSLTDQLFGEISRPSAGLCPLAKDERAG